VAGPTPADGLQGKNYYILGSAARLAGLELLLAGSGSVVDSAAQSARAYHAAILQPVLGVVAVEDVLEIHYIMIIRTFIFSNYAPRTKRTRNDPPVLFH